MWFHRILFIQDMRECLKDICEYLKDIRGCLTDSLALHDMQFWGKHPMTKLHNILNARILEGHSRMFEGNSRMFEGNSKNCIINVMIASPPYRIYVFSFVEIEKRGPPHEWLQTGLKQPFSWFKLASFWARSKSRFVRNLRICLIFIHEQACLKDFRECLKEIWEYVEDILGIAYCALFGRHIETTIESTFCV